MTIFCSVLQINFIGLPFHASLPFSKVSFSSSLFNFLDLSDVHTVFTDLGHPSHLNISHLFKDYSVLSKNNRDLETQ